MSTDDSRSSAGDFRQQFLSLGMYYCRPYHRQSPAGVGGDLYLLANLSRCATGSVLRSRASISCAVLNTVCGFEEFRSTDILIAVRRTLNPGGRFISINGRHWWCRWVTEGGTFTGNGRVKDSSDTRMHAAPDQ